MISEHRADASDAAAYRAAGWWGDDTIATVVARHAAAMPDALAFIADGRRYTWAEYHADSDRIARVLLAGGHRSGDRIAVMMPDGPAVHAVFVGIEKAGLVAVGIGARAGDREVAHLLTLTGAAVLVTTPDQHGRDASQLVADVTALGAQIDRLVLVDGEAEIVDTGLAADVVVDAGAAMQPLDADSLFLLNSTSGTTGLPKCVMHTQNRWFYFHHLAAAAGGFGADEVFLGVLPAPYGFGLWTAHFTPTILGCPAVVMERFDADAVLKAAGLRTFTVTHASAARATLAAAMQGTEQTVSGTFETPIKRAASASAMLDAKTCGPLCTFIAPISKLAPSPFRMLHTK